MVRREEDYYTVESVGGGRWRVVLCEYDDYHDRFSPTYLGPATSFIEAVSKGNEEAIQHKLDFRYPPKGAREV